jgi:hypothetical protein
MRANGCDTSLSPSEIADNVRNDERRHEQAQPVARERGVARNVGQYRPCTHEQERERAEDGDAEERAENEPERFASQEQERENRHEQEDDH